MYTRHIAGIVSGFFWAAILRIICSVLVLRGLVLGGVAYWRGRVIGGVDEQGAAFFDADKVSGTHGGAVGEAAALYGLAVGLPADLERGGAFGGAGVFGAKKVKKGGHDIYPRRARRLVVVNPSWGRLQVPTVLRQRVVDGAGKGQLFFSIPTGRGV